MAILKGIEVSILQDGCGARIPEFELTSLYSGRDKRVSYIESTSFRTIGILIEAPSNLPGSLWEALSFEILFDDRPVCQCVLRRHQRQNGLLGTLVQSVMRPNHIGWEERPFVFTDATISKCLILQSRLETNLLLQ